MLFGKKNPHLPGEAILLNDKVDLGRFARIEEKSRRLKEQGVSFETIEARAMEDGTSFNEALEAIHAETFNAQTIAS